MVSRIGDTADAEKLDEDIRAVWAMGYFNDVTAYVDNNDVLIVDVVEKPRINAIRVLGDDAVSEEDALGAIQTQPGKVLNEKAIINDLEIIKELYRNKDTTLLKQSTISSRRKTRKVRTSSSMLRRETSFM